MSYHSRRVLPPGASRKRKEREAFYASTSLKTVAPLTPVSRAVTATPLKSVEKPPLSSNQMLAGYMAYEFLKEGTIFGKKVDPARAEATPVHPTDPKRIRQNQSQIQPAAEAEPSGKPAPKGYAELALLLRGDGAHVPGIVNPTQLSRWLQL